jgi:hypothetical protein
MVGGVAGAGIGLGILGMFTYLIEEMVLYGLVPGLGIDSLIGNT